MTATAKDASQAIGRSPDQLTLSERARFAGLFIALEIYTPEAIPLRRIEAIGASIEDCVRTLKARGLDPLRFEYTQLGLM